MLTAQGYYGITDPNEIEFLRSFLDQMNKDGQSGYICARTGHHFEIPVVPPDKREELCLPVVFVKKEDRQVFCFCRTCGQVQWKEFQPDEFDHLMRDVASGEIYLHAS
jgi:hypothetical protein